MAPRFYIIDSPNHPWGDYGNILTQGMAYRNEGGRLDIERTGPFIPPITMPGLGEMVVTDRLRESLEQSGLNGFVFEQAHKRLIVHSDWHKWDQNSREPLEYPQSGEPEDYVLGQSHSPETASDMGVLWGITLDKSTQTHRDKPIVRNRRQIRLRINSWPGLDIFGAQGVLFIYIMEPAKFWLEQHVSGQLRFEEAHMTNV